MELECPNCGEILDLHEHCVQTDCPDCQMSLLVDHDGEFVNGHWRDRTKLIPHGITATLNHIQRRFGKKE